MMTVETAADMRKAALLALIATGLAITVPALAQVSGARPGTWAQRAPLPTARNEVVAVAFGDKIHVLGGSLQGDRYDLTRNDQYDPATNLWRALAPMPRGLNHQGAAVVGGRIYAVGGFVGANHKGIDGSLFAYDPARDVWTTLAPLSSPRGSVSAAALGGKLHIVGGRKNEFDVVATHEVYDPASDKWTTAAPLPKARDHMALVEVAGRLHAIGGRFGANEDMTGLHDIYDPASDAWTSAPALPTARGGGGATLYGDMILVFGGEDDKRTYDENEGFDLRTSQWLKLAPIPAGLHGFGAVTVGPYAYLAAGSKTMGGRGVTGELLTFSLP
jgi:hypothetical protein